MAANVLLLFVSALCTAAGKDPPIGPFIAPVDIPTPRIYPKTNATDEFGAVNMTAMAPAQRAALAQKTITKAEVMVANITNPPPSPKVVLSSAPADAAAPTPAVTAPADVAKTAVSAHMRVSGPGVTPFGPANQQRLINVFADVARNLTQSQFRVVLVSDAYTFRRRRLMDDAQPLSDVADVVMEVDAGTVANAPIVAAQISSIITNDTIAISLQRHGLSTWSIKMLSISVVAPSKTAATLPCQRQWTRWCLDGSPFTPSLIYLIIAFGVALILLLSVAIIVYREVARNTGKTGELEYPKEEQSFTIKERLQNFVTGHGRGKVAPATGSSSKAPLPGTR